MFADFSPSSMVAMDSGMPTFDYSGSGMSGNSNAAQSAYSACLQNGGNSVACGAQAWQIGASGNISAIPTIAGTISNGMMTPNKNSPIQLAQIGSGGNWLTGGSTVGVGKYKFEMPSLTGILTMIIGVIFIAAALFLLKSPTQIITKAVTGS